MRVFLTTGLFTGGISEGPAYREGQLENTTPSTPYGSSSQQVLTTHFQCEVQKVELHPDKMHRIDLTVV